MLESRSLPALQRRHCMWKSILKQSCRPLNFSTKFGIARGDFQPGISALYIIDSEPEVVLLQE